jgi:hypothetical protein
MLTGIEVDVGNSGLPKNLCQRRGVPRGVLTNIHDGEMEPEDLRESDDVS